MENKQITETAIAMLDAMSEGERNAIATEYARFKIKHHDNALITVSLLNIMENSTDEENELLKDLVLLFNRIETLKTII